MDEVYNSFSIQKQSRHNIRWGLRSSTYIDTLFTGSYYDTEGGSWGYPYIKISPDR